MGGRTDVNGQVRRRFLQVLFQYLLLGAALFLSAGTVRWGWGWAYLGVGLGILVLNAAVLPTEVIVERGKARKENVQAWDRVLSPLIAIPALGLPILSGFDQRFGWSPGLAWWAHAAGLAGVTLGQGLFTWAMTANRFFSTAVRIQVERDHAVATGGPYRYVRHPGYVGYIVALFGTAIGLGSLWALISAAVGTGLFVVRTALEDHTLREELDGYADYARQVRYRLLPGVW
jgi:protein-S-isoprenylcysteine O-methyltransferase Ste14